MKKLPNILTVFRIILVIPFLALMLWFNQINDFKEYPILSRSLLAASLGIFILAMLTDFLDGYIARKYNAVSEFGKLWDPLADKIITNAALILLSTANIVPVWITVILILRDMIVDGFRVVLAKNNVSVAANKWGKIKTVVVSIGIIFVMSAFTAINSNSWKITDTEIINIDYKLLFINIFNTPLIIGVILSIISGAIYAKTGWKYLYKN
ncbi:CDP-diacylglycerol--glycerol-3-phosphate 3-phosphatidyltransferase [Mycoplasma phocimorsus]|uniref:CDP-diacylglycerol--glycerol-3-phosphate 3-phosphatidyltransferase n=1 Tax=Mycoplasma phocimorsus TaxID=3045839 RepID=UPI0024C0D825|nr:CDP-diacylglycerol--glycerol-3-phosphate 3-phosphatidyltransferase [Mycoplasma phocimorsus]MDJ1646740.1 CDP-diacylglycerol--glycerol-3-phosphate 3-phosphatidyltransferase [Mycoplasma phocimorsus]MDJ1648249.1 CDP-diacylglycerol--glycerol-3-phosphate 3-phosphatidyltransferase [Mycoplasma phocimorsus]